MPLVLATASRALLEQCRSLGVDPAAAAREAGIPLASLDDPELRIDAERADTLWRVLYQRTGDSLLALHAAERLPSGAYGVVDFVVAYSPTLGEGLSRVAAYFPIIDPRGVLSVREAGGEWSLEFSGEGGTPLPPPAQQYTFAALVVRGRASSGLDWSPSRVELTFPATPREARAHRELFRCPVHFESAHSRLVLAPATAQTKIPQAQPALLAVLDGHARRLLAEAASHDREALPGLRRVLLSQLASGEVTLESAAGMLALTPRTLQRRLEEYGTTFGAELDQVRYALARTQLMGRNIALAEVAFMLGFADQAAFTRAFKRWSGTTPGAWRSGQGARG